jgi:monovalent cation:H+ antiporter-2, CPA2 family
VTVAAAAAGGDTALLLLETGLLVGGLGVLGRLAAPLGVSPVPLYLLAGLAIGDGGLVRLDASEDFVVASAQIGVILLLLTLGLEYTAAELSRSLRRNRLAGVVDAVLNAVPGAVAGMVLGLEPAGWLALAGVTWISSSGIVAKVLTDLRRLGNRETPVVLSILVLEDLAMAVYLPVLAALLAGASLSGASLSVALALAVVGVVLLAALRYGDRLSARIFSPDDEQLLLRVLGLTLLIGGIAERLQVSAAVGAFLVGLGMSGAVATEARRIVAPLRDLFAAVFFVSFGLSVDPRDIVPVLPAATLLGVVTLVTKLATGWWSAGREGVGPRGRLRAGTTLVARGEFSVVIAGLAVGAGILGIGAFAAAYVLIMAVTGPVLARYGERLAAPLLGAGQVRRAAGRPAAGPVDPGPTPVGRPPDLAVLSAARLPLRGSVPGQRHVDPDHRTGRRGPDLHEVAELLHEPETTPAFPVEGGALAAGER